MEFELSSKQVAKPPSIAEVPGQLAEHRRVVHPVKVGAWQIEAWVALHADFHRRPRRQQLYSPFRLAASQIRREPGRLYKATEHRLPPTSSTCCSFVNSHRPPGGVVWRTV